MLTFVYDAFHRHPNEARLLAVLLAGYGELEYALSDCVGDVLGSQVHGLKLLFRIRSETQRLDAADAVLRPAYSKTDLAGPYSRAIGAIRWCKTQRNTYAHCHWVESNGTLWYTNMEEIGRQESDNPQLKFLPVPKAILEEQVTYFNYTMQCFWHLRSSYARAIGKKDHLDGFALPKALQAPQRHDDPAKYNFKLS